jgi:hypothetical protein
MDQIAAGRQATVCIEYGPASTDSSDRRLQGLVSNGEPTVPDTAQPYRYFTRFRRFATAKSDDLSVT